jgi:hypothetical protein
MTMIGTRMDRRFRRQRLPDSRRNDSFEFVGAGFLVHY